MSNIISSKNDRNKLEENLTTLHSSSFSNKKLWDLKQTLASTGYVRLNDLLPENWKQVLRDEAIRLTEQSARRIDIVVETTDNSPRKMKTVNFSEITKNSPFIQSLYSSPALRKVLDTVAGTKISDCDYDEERMTMTRQENAGDTHGWHWGDYQWALIFIIEAPAVEHGGMLQCIPHTNWDKSAPQINRHIINNAIQSYYHATGDIYFFQTDTTLHRTYPLEKDCTRIILNFTFAGVNDETRDHQHETMNQIYDFDATG